VVLLGVGLAVKNRDGPSVWAVVRVALAGLLALALATHVLGVNPWLDEPLYSVGNYLEAKGPLIGTGGRSEWDRPARSLGLTMQL
jgi:hypothetical protein